MSMILNKEENIIKVLIPNSEATVSAQIKNIKDSEVTGFYTNDNEELKNELVEFLKKDYDYVVCVDDVLSMIRELDNYKDDFGYIYKDSMSSINVSYEYFKEINNKYLSIPRMFYSGIDNRYLKFENRDPVVKKLRAVLYGDITGFNIVKNDNERHFIISPFVKKDALDILDNKKKKIDVFSSDIVVEFGKGNDKSMRELFKRWLLEKIPSGNSVDAYVSQIELMSNEAMEDGLISKELYKIYDIDELNKVVPLITESEKYKRRVENSNHINSAALNHYIDFLKVYYDKDLFLKEVFIDDSNEYDKLCNLLNRKKNIVLEGAPGVGKTFMAKRLAYSIIGEKAKEQILSVQFHQSFSYEDFIEGIRPKKDDEGKFVVSPGMFYDFVETALKNPKKNYYVIIDEINRGNLSKIFGELMKLIESDKRYDFVSNSYEYVILPYSRNEFKIPNNIYIIGTMNTADRSLAMVDYALRRRFAFYHVSPKFNSRKFTEWLRKKNGLKEADINEIITRMNNVNASIVEDLNDGFEIGHSYFVDTIDPTKFKQSYDEIIEYEIIPLIEEYFIDDNNKIEDYKNML